MEIYLFNFAKKQNSTKRPEISAGTAYQVNIKAPASVMNLRIEFRGDQYGLQIPTNYNYAYVQKFQRYYFVHDWLWDSGIWTADMTVDVLASFKTDIGNSTCYIERSAFEWDGNIIDPLYPAKTNCTIGYVPLACAWKNVAPSGGSYVVGIVGHSSAYRVGVTTYYALTPEQFVSLMSELLSSAFVARMSIGEISEGLTKALVNPLQYISSCMWFPFAAATFGNNTEPIALGYWTTTVNAIIVSDLMRRDFITATIPEHPQNSRGAYMNFAPFSECMLFIPPFGAIPLDLSVRNKGNYLYCPVYIDHITGKASIYINMCESASALTEYNMVTMRTAQFGIPIQLGQVIQDYIGAASGAASALASMTRFDFAGMLSGAVSAVQSFMPQLSVQGVNGAFTQQVEPYYAVVRFMIAADDDLTHFGRPLFSDRTISAIPGYIKCSDAHADFSGLMAAERAEIERYMMGGFYYE